MPVRLPTPAEQRFLTYMVKEAALRLPANWIESLRVKPMDEGAMGSLLLFPDGKETDQNVYGKTAAEFQFRDADGIYVLASLNLDEQGRLFELDIWKESFEPLIRFPEL